MGVMNMESELVEKGEEVYRKRKEKKNGSVFI